MERDRAFTLIELLIVIGILSVLLGLSVAGLGQAIKFSHRVAGASQMRQIGIAVLTYTHDNNDFLPGPMKVGQGAYYNPTNQDQLASVLGSYLGVNDESLPQVLGVFIPPAYAREMDGLDLKEARPFVMNISVTINGRGFKPWGSSSPEANPAKLGKVKGTWGFADADQLNPLVKDQPWASKTPLEPVYGKQRLAWFFDGSVQQIDEDDLLASKSNDAAPAPPPPPSKPSPPKK